MSGFLGRFQLDRYGTNPGREATAGIATFLAMAYIIPVNTAILSMTGIPGGAVMLATCLASALGTYLMAFYANVPFAQAPGMGLNAFFTFTVVFGLGFSWQQALAMVFICGIFNLIIVLTGFRQKLINAIPTYMKHAIGAGIGGFILYIGIKNAGLLEFIIDPGTYFALGDANSGSATIIANSSVIPTLVPFKGSMVLLALAAIVLTIILVAKKVKGGILIAIITATVAGIPFGFVKLDMGSYFGQLGGYFSDLGSVFGQALIAIPSLFSDVVKIPIVLAAIFALSLTDIMDTIGTLIGAGSKIFTPEEMRGEGNDKRFRRAMNCDIAVTTKVGAVLGTSTVTTYIESGVGIEAGGRTGLASVWTATLFLASVVLAPFAMAVPGYATAPALIVVGALMLAPVGKLGEKLLEPAISVPVAFTVFTMLITYSITNGIALGFIAHCIIRVCMSDSQRKEYCSGEEGGGKPSLILVVLTCLFALGFVVTALI